MLRRYLLWPTAAVGSFLLLLMAVIVLRPAVARAQFIRQVAPELGAAEVISFIIGGDILLEKLTVSGTSSTAQSITILQGRLGFAPSTVPSAVIYWDTSNGFNVGNQWNMCDGCYIVADNYSPKRPSESSTFQGAHGLTLAPQAAVDACSGAREGQLTTLTTDGRLYQCDGVTNGKLSHIFSGSASLDFPNLVAGAKSSALTVTVTGAATTDTDVNCQPAASLGDNLRVFEQWVSSSNTVSVRLWNTDDTDAEDLAPTTFTCTVQR